MRFLILWAILVIAISAAPKSTPKSIQQKRTKNSNNLIQAQKLRRQTYVRDMIKNHIERLRKRLRPKSRLKRAHRGKRGKIAKNRQKQKSRFSKFNGSSSSNRQRERKTEGRHHQVHHTTKHSRHQQHRPVRGAGKRHKRRNYAPSSRGKLNMDKFNDRRTKSSGMSERGAAGFGNMNNAFADAGPSVVGNMRDCFGRSLNVLDMGSSRFGCNHNSLT